MEEIWTIYVLPVIQYLIGPIVVGVVVYHLTNKTAIKKEKNIMNHQLNIHYSKVKWIISLEEELNKALDNLDKYRNSIEQMKNGDYSSVKEELESIRDENACLLMFEELKTETSKNIDKLRNRITASYSDLNNTSKDLLPPEIHAEITEIIESKQVELDLVRHKQLLKNIKEHSYNEKI